MNIHVRYRMVSGDLKTSLINTFMPFTDRKTLWIRYEYLSRMCMGFLIKLNSLDVAMLGMSEGGRGFKIVYIKKCISFSGRLQQYV